jgi:Zn-dependent protease
MDLYNALLKIAIYALPVIFAITLHEAAHGYVAKHFGDHTAYMLGRVTLNPAKHIDLIGTVLVPLAMILFAGILFGWAKPVPINERNLRSPKRDMLWVAAAGPGANVAMALAWAVLAKVLLAFDAEASLVSDYWVKVAEAGILVNAVIGILNLIPLLPLDGGRIVASLLPDRMAYAYAKTEPFGIPILLLLMVTPVLGWVMLPLVNGFVGGIYTLFRFST